MHFDNIEETSATWLKNKSNIAMKSLGLTNDSLASKNVPFNQDIKAYLKQKTLNQASSRNLPISFNQNANGLKYKQSDQGSDSSGAQKTILRQQNSEIIEPQI